MKHKETYFGFLGFALAIAGAAVIVFGLLYSYGIFSAKVALPAVFDNKGQLAATAAPMNLSIDNSHTGKTTVALPIDVNQLVGRGADVIIQYLFATLLLIGGGQIAKVGVNIARLIIAKPEGRA